MYFAVIGQSIQYMSIRSYLFNALYRFSISLLMFYIPVQSVERGVLMYSTIILDLSIFSFSFESFCFIYYKALLFDMYTFRIILSSWYINPFVIMQYQLFLCLFNFCFEVYIISYSCKPLPLTFAWYIYFCFLTCNPPMLLILNSIFCKQHVDGLCIFSCSANLCLLIDLFRPFQSLSIPLLFLICFQCFSFISLSCLPVSYLNIQQNLILIYLVFLNV